MIESLFFDAKESCMVVTYTDGTNETYNVACDEYKIAPGVLPFNAQGPTIILAALVADLIQRVRDLEYARQTS